MKKIVLLLIGILAIVAMVGYFEKIKPVQDKFKDNEESRLVDVIYATQDLKSGELIYANFISRKTIKYTELKDNYFTSYKDMEDIVGKCVNKDIEIKKGDILKKDYIIDCE